MLFNLLLKIILVYIQKCVLLLKILKPVQNYYGSGPGTGKLQVPNGGARRRIQQTRSTNSLYSLYHLYPMLFTGCHGTLICPTVSGFMGVTTEMHGSKKLVSTRIFKRCIESIPECRRENRYIRLFDITLSLIQKRTFLHC